MFSNKRIKDLEYRCEMLEGICSDIYDFIFKDYKCLEDIKRINDMRWAIAKVRISRIEDRLPVKKRGVTK